MRPRHSSSAKNRVFSTQRDCTRFSPISKNSIVTFARERSSTWAARSSRWPGENALQTRGERPASAIERTSADLNAFRRRGKLAHVIVVNISSTEPPVGDEARQFSWRMLAQKLDRDSESPVPASSIYAIAAMQAGCDYVNFTPSAGSDLPALEELALEKG